MNAVAEMQFEQSCVTKVYIEYMPPDKEKATERKSIIRQQQKKSQRETERGRKPWKSHLL